MINRTYQYRLYPTKEQAEALEKFRVTACQLYNHALQHRRNAWKTSRKNIAYFDQSKLLTVWRNESPFDNPLNFLPVTVGQHVLRKLDKSFLSFFNGVTRYPRFKHIKYFRSFTFTYDNGIRLMSHADTLKIYNVGYVKIRKHRELISDRIKQVTITKKASGWYVGFLVELDDPTPQFSDKPVVGIDIGLRNALALSDGTIIESPRYLERSLERLKELQRSMDRKVYGSRRREKAVKQYRKLHEHITNQRRDFWHKITCWLVDNYNVIVLEDMSLSFMNNTRRISRMRKDVGLSVFRKLLSYKAIEAGVEIVYVDPAYTSQVCSQCGCTVPKKIHVRIHICSHCGLELDRDVNAAKNILYRSGLALQE